VTSARRLTTPWQPVTVPVVILTGRVWSVGRLVPMAVTGVLDWGFESSLVPGRCATAPRWPPECPPVVVDGPQRFRPTRTSDRSRAATVPLGGVHRLVYLEVVDNWLEAKKVTDLGSDIFHVFEVH
jgi:hypothetical protein